MNYEELENKRRQVIGVYSEETELCDCCNGEIEKQASFDTRECEVWLCIDCLKHALKRLTNQ